MRLGLLGSVLQWLRAGYPDGVPPKDYSPLVALLRRSLTDDELAEVVRRLRAEHPDRDPNAESIEEAIQRVTSAPPTDADTRQVAARLAAAGWPLEGFTDGEANDPARSASSAGTEQARAGVGGRVLSWLRAGYPLGVPERDYVPLLALLRRQLTNDEAMSVANALIDAQPDGAAGEGTISKTDAKVLITKVIDDLPLESDVERVRVRLSAQGWPFDEERG